ADPHRRRVYHYTPSARTRVSCGHWSTRFLTRDGQSGIGAATEAHVDVAGVAAQHFGHRGRVARHRRVAVEGGAGLEIVPGAASVGAVVGGAGRRAAGVRPLGDVTAHVPDA